jgi:hypothetical protein
MFSLFEGSKNGGNGCVSSSGKQGTFPQSSSRGTSASEQKLMSCSSLGYDKKDIDHFIAKQKLGVAVTIFPGGSPQLL